MMQRAAAMVQIEEPSAYQAHTETEDADWQAVGQSSQHFGC